MGTQSHYLRQIFTVSIWLRTAAASIAMLCLAASVTGAQTVARWTFITILSGEYANMQSRLESVGAGHDVNVLVLHDGLLAGDSIAYRLPVGPGPAIDIPLSSFLPGAVNEIEISNASVLNAFLEYVQTNYPADHYLLSIRCNMDFFTFLLEENDEGIAMTDFAEGVLAPFTQRAGKKIDVFNTGFCLSAVADWMYLAADYADYYVGSMHTSNPPVAAFWRNYRWAFELINGPEITPEEVARRIVQIFSSQAYDGYDADYRATCSAIDLSQIDAFKTSFTTVVQLLTTRINEFLPAINRALSQTQKFGYYWRRDALQLFAQTARFANDPELNAAVYEFQQVYNRFVLEVWDQHFRTASGVSLPMFRYEQWHGSLGNEYMATYGAWPLETGWKTFVDALPEPADPRDSLLITEVDPHPHDTAGNTGDRVEIYNKGPDPADLRGLIIDDWDDTRRDYFLGPEDVDAGLAILQPGQHAVINIRLASANPLASPANAQVFARSYGVEITSYTALSRTEFSSFDDQAALIDGDTIIDAVVWDNKDGEATAAETVNLEDLQNWSTWIGAYIDDLEGYDTARHYLRPNWLANPDNSYERLAFNFSFIAAHEEGSIQRIYRSGRYAEGTSGLDSASVFVCANQTSFGAYTPEGLTFTPQPVPSLLITEIAPNITVSSTTGDMIELYNNGTTEVDLYDVVLTDLDPGLAEEDVAGDEVPLISSSIGPGVAMLAPGKLAVIVCVSESVSQPAPDVTDYGLRILWPAGEQFELKGDQVALVNRVGGDLIDSVIYANQDLQLFMDESDILDFVFDNDGLTATAGGFGFVITTSNGWFGADDQRGLGSAAALIASAATCVRFAHGQDAGGSIQRKLGGSPFLEGSPDGPNQFDVLAETSFGEMSCGGLGIALAMPAALFTPDDACYLSATLCNPGPGQLTAVPVFVILDVGIGQYWFAPSWTMYPPGVDMYTLNLPVGSTTIDIIPAFVWPTGTGAGGPFTFWGALTDTQITQVIGDMAEFQFSYNE